MDEVGFLATGISAIAEAVRTGITGFGTELRILITWVTTLTFSVAILGMALAPSPAALVGLFWRIFAVMECVWLMEFIELRWSDVIDHSLVLGMSVVPEDPQLKASDPSTVFWFYWNVASVIALRIRDLILDWKVLLNVLEILTYAYCYYKIATSGFKLTIRTFLAWATAAVMMIPVLFATAFAPFAPLAFISEKGMGYFVGSIIRLVTFGVVMGVGGLAVQSIMFVQGGTVAEVLVVSKVQAVGVAILCVFITMMAEQVDKATEKWAGGGIGLLGALSDVTRMAGAGMQGFVSTTAGTVARNAGGAVGGAATAAATMALSALSASPGSASSSTAPSAAPGWQETLRSFGVDPSGMSDFQGKAGAEALKAEAAYRQQNGKAAMTPKTAEWVARAATQPASEKDRNEMKALGLNADNANAYQAQVQLREAREQRKGMQV